MPNRRSRAFVIAYYAVFGAVLLLSGTIRPEHNWDLIAYVGSVKALQTNDPVRIHEFAYSELQTSRAAGTHSMADPVTDNPYRTLMRSDAGAFAGILPFYQVRIAYVGLLYLLYSAGMNVVVAAQCISAIAMLLGMLLLYPIAVWSVSKYLQYLVPPIAFALGMVQTARLSTPDALALLAILACTYFFLRDHRTLLVLLPLLVTIRTDLLVLVLLFCISVAAIGKVKRGFVLLSFGLAAAIVLALNWYFGFPGWKSIFYFTFVDRLALADGGQLGAVEYGLALLKGVWAALNNPSFILFWVIAGLAMFLVRDRFRGISGKAVRRSEVLHVLAIAVVYAIVRFLIFPLPDQRFFIGPSLLAALALLALLSEGPDSGAVRGMGETAAPIS